MKTKILSTLNELLKKEESDHNEHLMLREILQKYEGKKITARIQKDLPDGFKYGTDVNGAVISHGGKHNHFVCYFEQMNDFNVLYFDKCNSPYNDGAKAMAEKLRTILSNPDGLINAFTALYAAWKDLELAAGRVDKGFDSFSNPAFYELCRLGGVPSEVLSNIRYKKYDK